MYEKIIFFLTITTVIYFAFALIKYGSPKIYLLSVLFLLPFMNFLGTKTSMGGFKVFDIVTFLSFLYLIKFFFIDNFLDKKYFQLVLFCLLMVFAVIGSIFSEHPGDSLIDVLKILPIFIYARFLILECIQDPLFHYKIIKTLKIVYGIAIIFLIIQLAVGLKFTFYSVLNINTFDPLRESTRYPGYFNDSQVQGQFFAAGFFIFLYNPSETYINKKLIYYFFAIICLVAVYVSGSRSAFLGVTLSAFISLILIGRKYIIYIFIMGIVVLPLVTEYPKKSGVLSRSKDSAEDFKFRQSIWIDAYRIAERHPLFGIGSGNYLQYTIKHNPNQYFELENHEIMYFDQPENGYLKILVEFGFFVFLFFLLMVITPVLNGLKLFFLNRSDSLIILLISSLFSWLVAFNTVYSILDLRMMIIVATVIVLLITYPKLKAFNETD